MSSVTTTPEPTEAPFPHDGHANGHNPHLAHHFDTPEQQIASGKLGMWVFLATEILMFGGLFCAYSIYRHNHPDVFEYAHQWLSKPMGAINTIVLITSSLTMAWGVRLAQLGRQGALVLCLALTIVGGYVFMGIKSIEYQTKWDHSLWLGQRSNNMYVPRPFDPANKELVPGGGAPGVGKPKEEEKKEEAEHKAEATAKAPDAEHHATAASKPVAAISNPEYFDPNAGTADAAKIRPDALAPAGLAPKAAEELSHRQLSEEQIISEREEEWNKLPKDLDKERTYTFFQIYFLMTGLHGIHVLVGMALIFWIMVRAVSPQWKRTAKLAGLASVGVFFLYLGIILANTPTLVIGIVITALAIFGSPILSIVAAPKRVAAATTAGEFGPDYLAPVDIVGLYWHLVDLIWIFLFPLLYLIGGTPH